MLNHWLGEVFSHPDLAGVLGIVAKTTVIYLFVLLGLRLLGSRELGQTTAHDFVLVIANAVQNALVGEMNVYDLLLILMMANAVQNAMTKANGNLLVAFTSAGTLLLLGWLIGAVIARRPWLRTKLLGSPTVIIHDGQIVRANVKREGLTEDEVATELRKRGLTEIDAVRLAILEIDGSLSVVPKDHAAGTGGGGDGR